MISDPKAQSGMLARLATVLLALGFVFASNAAAVAAQTNLEIEHSQLGEGSIQMLVTVPGSELIALDSLAVTIDGTPVEAAAEIATGEGITRTAVLAIDTSNSMAGERIAGAKAAAALFLDTIPRDVKVGLLTFDTEVNVHADPTLEREGLYEIIDDLTLRQRTALYDGVSEAIDLTGSKAGHRQVLVLSDGKENTGSELEPLLNKITESGVKIDVVALGVGKAATRILEAMTQAGHGTVISTSDPQELEQIFAAEATSLTRQVLVTAEVPTDQTDAEANVTVAIEAGGESFETSAFVTVTDPGAASETGLATPTPEVPGNLGIPSVVMYAGIIALGLGLIGVLFALFSGREPQPSQVVGRQLKAYGATGSSSDTEERQLNLSGLRSQAAEAAEKALARNRGLEARIERSLDSAGLALKPAEWILVHLGVGVSVTLLGTVLSSAHPVGVMFFLVVGFVAPWLFLSIKRSRRINKFSAALADTLQLMSGSLSAGLSLTQSLDTIVGESEDPVSTEFRRAIVESRLGVGVEDALEGVAERMDSKDFAWVVMAIRIQREVGGNLAELLDKVADTLREREYLRRHVRALSAEGRLSAWILGALPPVFLLYLVLTRPDYVNPLFTTPLGILMSIAMVVLLAVGIFWMSRVAKVEL